MVMEDLQPLEACNACSSDTTIISHLDGALLRSPSFFPYYMLMALEAGGPLRAFLLLLLSPFILLLSQFSELLSIHVLSFVTLCGLKVSEVHSVSKAVLPKFYLEDLHPHSYRAFLSCKRRYAITSHPRVFVEHFLTTHLGADGVFGTEVQVTQSGYCTGFVAPPGVLYGQRKMDVVKKFFGDSPPDLGLGSRRSDLRFLSLCKEAFLVASNKKVQAVRRDQYLTPLVFHDGRLVMRPSPLSCVAIVLWMPFGVTLAMVRIMVGLSFPKELAYPIEALLGLQLRVKGAPPFLPSKSESGIQQEGVLFVCTHRTLADPTFLTMSLRRKVRALTYSVSKISELIAPIKATRLTRNREEDAKIIQKLLSKEDLFVCPEGTTCREPFLLRFSPLFADLADRIVPVALNVTMSMFHGTTARGYKFLDAFFLLMNPRPKYDVSFLEALPIKEYRAGGKTGIEIANYVQKRLAAELGFQCTNFNRKDKYTLLAGHDGSVK